MTIQPVWTEETLVKTYETDFRQQMKPAGFFQIMQDAAAHHAEHLGVGFEALLAHNMVWILSRVKVTFHSFPKMQEKVILKTWPKGIQQRLFFMRDFEITGGDGRRFASASTAWLLVNLKARRLLMPSMLPVALPENSGLFALPEPLEKIQIPEGGEEKLLEEARFRDIDLAGHVSNWRYVEWICDCFSIEHWQQHEPAWIQVNYVNEVKPGERVSVCASPKETEPGLWLVQGANLNTGVRAFEAAIAWK